MRARTDKSARDARDFAAQHTLTFHGDAAPALPSAFDNHPFSGMRRDQVVSGQWRGRTVQRFLAEDFTVELVALPRPLPQLQVLPAGTKRGAMNVGGSPVATGNPAFDAAFTVYTDEPEYAQVLLDAHLQEALLHPAFAGRSLTIDADVMYLWTAAPTVWDEARVRLELLSILIARIPLAVWERFDRSGRVAAPVALADGAWIPAAVEPETNQWEYAEVAPESQRAPDHAAGHAFVAGAGHGAPPQHAYPQAQAQAQARPDQTDAPILDGAFLPDPTVPEHEYGDFAVAPMLPH